MNLLGLLPHRTVTEQGGRARLVGRSRFQCSISSPLHDLCDSGPWQCSLSLRSLREVKGRFSLGGDIKMGKLPMTIPASGRQAVSSQAFKIIHLLNFREVVGTFCCRGHRKQTGHEHQAKGCSWNFSPKLTAGWSGHLGKISTCSVPA